MTSPGDLVTALHRAATRYPSAGVATVDNDGWTSLLTYPELVRGAAEVLGGLRRRGVAPGDVVVLAGLGLPDLFPALWACVLGGFAPLPVGDPRPDRMAALRRKLDGATVVEPADVADLRAGEPAAGPWHRPDPADTALLLQSSGSTGTAKIVPLTHGGLAEFAADSGQMLRWRRGEVTLNWLPLDHSGALLLYHLLPVFLGLTNVHAPTPFVLADPLRWLDLMAGNGVNHSWAPSFGFQLVRTALAARPDAHWDLSGVRSLVSGGEQITPELVRGFVDATAPFGITPGCFVPAWGMTETCTGITMAPFDERTSVHRVLRSSMSGRLEPAGDGVPDQECVAFVAVGPPAPGARVRVVDEQQRALPDRWIGRLQVHSGRVTPGYLGDDVATARAFPGGDRWFDTGDLAFLADGQVVITGRGSDVVIINGHNYLCHEIEGVAGDVDGVRRGHVAACGIPDGETGTESLAVVFVPELDRPPGTDPVGAVRAALYHRLRLTARHVVAVAESDIPRTSGGKIRRAELARRLAARSGTVLDTVRRVIGAAVAPNPVADETPFFDLGLTSVTSVRAHVRLQQELGREFPVGALFAYPSIAALAGHLDAGPVGAERAAADTPASLPPQTATVAPPDGRIAVIGLAIRFPGARTLEDYWANLRDGVSSIATFDAAELAESGLTAGEIADPDRRPFGGVLDEVDGFDAEFFGMSPTEAARTHPAHRLFLECCYHALESAGYPEPTARTGVYAGAGMNLYDHQNGGTVVDGDPLEAMRSSLGVLPDFLASRVAHRLGLTGPAVGVQTACSTSLVAVHLAAQALRSGDAEMALAGAAAIHLPQHTGYRWHTGSVLSESGRCRPFDEHADGTVGGNGVAVVVLKPLARAIADGDTVHAVISATAVNNDGAAKVGFTAPSVSGQVDVVRQALHRAGIEAAALSYVEAHGTGTRLGDAVEVEALRQALGPASARTGPCLVGSVKSSVGHLDTCAGMAGLVKVILMLRHRTLVPIVGLDRPSSVLPLDGGPIAFATGRGHWSPAEGPRRAGISSLGVGGTNAFVVVEEAPAPPVRQAPPVAVAVPLSGHSEAAVRELAENVRTWLVEHPGAATADVLATMAVRPALPYRAAVCGRTAGELAAALAETPTVAHGEGPLTFVFSGQGTAYSGMAGHLYRGSEAGRAVLDECDRTFRETAGQGLLPVLLGDEPLASTDHGQPALFATQLAAVAAWRSFGVAPDHVVGHSVGEIAALATAGALSIEDGLRLTAQRGRLMATRMAAGGMAAVRCDHDTAHAVARAAGLDVAAHNGPDRFVLAGTDQSLSRAVTELDGRGIPWRRLDVDRAYHSRMVDPILPELRELLGSVRFGPVRLPVATTLGGRPLPAGTVLGADHLAEQARQPVRFAAALASLADAGCRRYLEIGPRDELTRLGLAVLPETAWTATYQLDTDQEASFLLALAELYRQGSRVDWRPLSADGRRLTMPGYPFQRRQLAPPIEAPEAPVVEEGPLDTVRTLVSSQLGIGADEVDVDRSIVAMGGDSLNMVSLTRELERHFGVRMPVGELFTVASTPRKLSALVAQRAAPTARPAVADGARPVVQAPPAVPAPAPEVTPVRPAPPVAGGGGGLDDLIRDQLRLGEKLVDTVSDLMRRQLDAVGGGAPAEAAQLQPPGAGRPQPAAAELAPPASALRPRTAAAREELASKAGQADFSLYFFGDYPDQDRTEKYAHLLDAAAFADRNGFHAVWLPERHFASFGGLFPNPSVLAAAIATRTSRLRLHAGSVVLPLHDPIRVAEEWSVVDNLSGGRAGMCFASGWHANDFALAPGVYGEHRKVMYERLETVRRLWSGEPIEATSGTGEPISVTLYPRPVQPRPPLFAAVVGNPDSYLRAAESELGVVTNLMAQSVEQLGENVRRYRQRIAAQGLDPATGRVVVLVHTYLGEDEERARGEAFGPFCAYLRSSLELLNNVTNSLGIDLDLDNTPEEDVDFLLRQAFQRYCETRALIGTADSVRPIVDSLVAAGVDEIACFVDFGLPADRMLAGLEPLNRLRERHSGAVDAALSPAQRRLWLVERMYPGRNTYHEPKAILLRGQVDVEALRTALTRTVNRHEQLRSAFSDVDGEPRRTVRSAVTVELPLVDRAGCEVDEVLAELLAQDEGFDLAAAPLVHAKLVRLAGDRHLLFLMAHHIVFDSASTAVFCQDLAAFYRARDGEPAALPVLPAVPPRPDEASLADGVEFWTRELSGVPPLRLPTDRPRTGSPSTNGAHLVHEFGAELADRLGALGRAHGYTLFMLLVGAVGAVLGRLAGSTDVVVGTAVTNRPPEARDRVGLFLDTIALRLDLAGDPDFAELGRRVMTTTARAYAHQDVPFDTVVDVVNPERVPGVNPLFQTLVEFEEQGELDFDPPAVTAEALDVPSDRAPFDLTFYWTRHRQGLRAVLEYDADLFEAATAERVVHYVERLLRRAVDAPSAPLSALTAQTAADEMTLAGWHREEAPDEDDPQGLHELVERQAARTPEAVALLGDAGAVTYRDLDADANRWANLLAARGVEPGCLVAVCLPRGRDLITVLLGILKSGAAYVPLDPALPVERITRVLTASGATLLVTDRAAAGEHPGLRGGPVLFVDELDPESPDTPRGIRVDPSDLAYCMFTSGSTGAPKGVAVPHRGPVNLVRWQLRHRRPLRTLQWTSPGFDVSVQEIFATLASGASLVLVDDEVRYEPSRLVDQIRRHQVQRLHMPQTPLRYLVEYPAVLPALLEVWQAGERCVVTPALAAFLDRHPRVTLHNQYGPTETSIVVTTHVVDPATEPVPPIGRPIPNVTIRLLDGAGQTVPIGAAGEIHIGGPAVAAGYLGDQRETVARFVPDPVAPGRRLYRSGDLGRWRADGVLEFLGRTDDQVKIRGNRVEPGETQWALSQLDGVRQAAVVVGRDNEGEPRLYAYVVLADRVDDSADWVTPLRIQLGATLPDYLIPEVWRRVDRMPVGPSGKLDPAGLRIDGGELDIASGEGPRTPIEETVHGLWCAELGLPAVPVDRSLFELGGNSLAAVRLLSRVRERFAHPYPMQQFLRQPTIRAMAVTLNGS